MNCEQLNQKSCSNMWCCHKRKNNPLIIWFYDHSQHLITFKDIIRLWLQNQTYCIFYSCKLPLSWGKTKYKFIPGLNSKRLTYDPDEREVKRRICCLENTWRGKVQGLVEEAGRQRRAITLRLCWPVITSSQYLRSPRRTMRPFTCPQKWITE